MTKVKVQEATKELSDSAKELLTAVTASKNDAKVLFDKLKKMADEKRKQIEEEKQELEREEKRKAMEAAEGFMTAYSSEKVPEAAPEVAEEKKEEAKPAPAEEPKQKEEPVTTAPVKEPVKVEAPQQAAPAEVKPAAEKPFAEKPAAVRENPEGRKSFQPRERTDRPDRPQQRPFGQRPQQDGRPMQDNRPQRQGPYGRPVQPDQGSQQAGGRPMQDNRPQRQGPYGRPVQPQQGGQNGAPRAAQPQGQFNRPEGGRPMGQRPQQGGMPRPGFGTKKTGMGDLTPPVEKERVSNYDPNKKQYIRQNDPERNAQKAAKMNRSRNVQQDYDDDVIRGKRKKKDKIVAVKPEPVKIEKAFMTNETITVKDLSERIGKPVAEIIKKLFMLGIMATINNELDFDTAQLVSSEFGVELEMKLAETAEDALSAEDVSDSEDQLVRRPPIVTVMGHVDHGKTSVLDYIRNAHVTAGEAGGITQHIGAYTTTLNGQKITFLDTPGHEAFTAMRARGAQATDIAILVVAADDGVMPQTIEAINHAKAANVPIIVAINKMDKPTANPDRVRQQLTEYDLVTEEWGGDTIMVPVSAHTGEGIDQLLEMILLVADVENFRANPNRKARGIIVEARLDKGRGPVATVLVKNGTLRVGDTIVAGMAYGRVRAMVNDKGERVQKAGPSEPVEVIGFNDVPDAGDIISAVDDDKLSRQVAEERRDKARAALIKAQSKTSLDDLFSQISAGEVKDLNIIVKADVQGSVEAVKQSLEKLSNEEVRVHCIHGGVGAITETDIMLASASNAIIIGFNVRHDNNVRDLAEHENVDVRLYRVIYQAIEDVEKAMKGLLAPEYKENILGRAQVRQTFRVSGVGTIAGCFVIEGKIQRNASARLLRDNVVIRESKIDSLKRFKDDAKEVAQGYECGIGLENFNDIKEGDEIECFLLEEVER